MQGRQGVGVGAEDDHIRAKVQLGFRVWGLGFKGLGFRV